MKLGYTTRTSNRVAVRAYCTSLPENKKSVISRLGKLFGYASIYFVISVVTLEIGLQVLSFVFKEDRSKAGRMHGGVSILCLGDSNTFGMYVSAEQAWPSQLEKILNQNHFVTTVYNYGYPGNSSTRIAQNLDEMITMLQPDLVMILVGVNDSWNYPVYYSFGEEHQNFVDQLLEKSRVIRLLKILLRSNHEKYIEGERRVGYSFEKLKKERMSDRKSFVDQALSGKHSAISQGEDVSLDGRDWKFGVQFVEDKRMRVDSENLLFRDNHEAIDQNYVETMTDIRKLLQEKHIPMIVLNYGADRRVYQAANHRIDRLTDDFVIFDLTEKFQRSCENDKCDNLLVPDLHPNARGHRLYAELVYKSLFERPETAELFDS